MSLPPRAVVVHRATELTELVARHGTRQKIRHLHPQQGIHKLPVMRAEPYRLAVLRAAGNYHADAQQRLE